MIARPRQTEARAGDAPSLKMSDEEHAYILSDGAHRESRVATASTWYKRLALVGAASLLAGVFVGKSLSQSAGERDLGTQTTKDCDCVTEQAVAPRSSPQREARAVAQGPTTAKAEEEHDDQAHHEHHVARRADNVLMGMPNSNLDPYETPMGLNNAEKPGLCRDYATQHNYLAWGWANDRSTDESLRLTCRMYKRIGVFHGRPQDHAHVTGCTIRSDSPVFACNTASHEDNTDQSEARSEESPDSPASQKTVASLSKSKIKYPNIVRGLPGPHVRWETPMGTGTATSAGDCRAFAADQAHKYVAFAFIGDQYEHDKSLRSSCLFFPEFTHFRGYSTSDPRAPTLGCTDTKRAPANACEEIEGEDATVPAAANVETASLAKSEVKNQPASVTQPAEVTQPVMETQPEPVAESVAPESVAPLPAPTEASSDDDESGNMFHVVRGLIGLDQAEFETPLGTGTAKNPSQCRDYAADPSHTYRAWAWVSQESSDEEMRETCLFYHNIIPFQGRPQDLAHVTGCTNRGFSPEFACER